LEFRAYRTGARAIGKSLGERCDDITERRKPEAAHRSGVASASGELGKNSGGRAGRALGGVGKKLWEELEKSSGRSAAKFVADEARGRRAGK
jgi:hypothetical protein